MRLQVCVRCGASGVCVRRLCLMLAVICHPNPCCQGSLWQALLTVCVRAMCVRVRFCVFCGRVLCGLGILLCGGVHVLYVRVYLCLRLLGALVCLHVCMCVYVLCAVGAKPYATTTWPPT